MLMLIRIGKGLTLQRGRPKERRSLWACCPTSEKKGWAALAPVGAAVAAEPRS